MKLRLFTVFNFLVWFAAFVLTSAAQPNWELLPQNYEYSMTITGKITTDGNFSIDETDLVGAFVNDECRGVAQLKYEYPQNAYFAYLFVYGSAPGEKITFKLFDASENLVVATKDTINFFINRILGSPDEPVVLASNLLNSKAELTNFMVPNQIGTTIFDGNNVNLYTSSDSLVDLVTTFETSSYAKVFVNEIEQVSGETKNDFTNPLEYLVVSQDFTDTVLFSVQIEINENDSPTAVNISNTKIYASTEINTIIATLSADDPDIDDGHEFSLVQGDGDNDLENHLFTIDDDNLILTSPLNFEDQDILNIRISATDSQGAFVNQNISLTVTSSNEPPKFLNVPLDSVLQDDSFEYTIQVSDDGGGVVDLITVNMPDWMTYNSTSKTISGIPDNDDVGDYIFKIVASDGSLESVQLVKISVVDVNDQPVINYPIEDQLFLSNRENEIHLPTNYFSDSDIGDSLTYRLENDDNSALPEWLNFDQKTLVVSGKPPEGNLESLKLKLTATDTGNLEQSLSFEIIIGIPTATGDLEKDKIFNCYPNPVIDKLFIKFLSDNSDTQISLLDIEGRLLKTISTNAGCKSEISFEEMLPGIYFIQFRQGKNIQMRKIVKQ